MIAARKIAVGRRRTTVNIADGNDTPIVRFSGLTRGTTLGSSGVYPILRYQTDYQYVYNLSRLLTPKNALRVGTDIRRQQLNDRADQYSRGYWIFGTAGGLGPVENFRRGFVSSYEKAGGRISSETGRESSTSTSRMTGKPNPT
jgi:hypothetical protein